MGSQEIHAESDEEVAQELIEFLREIELHETKPVEWGRASHKAYEKLNELESRGVVDQGGRRYNKEGDLVDPIQVRINEK